MSKISEVVSIFQKCSSRGELSNPQIKSMIETLAICVHELHVDGAKTKERTKREFQENQRSAQVKNKDIELEIKKKFKDVDR